MPRLSIYFNEEEDPLKSKAPRHKFCDVMTISLLCALCGGETAVDMEHFGRMKTEFLREFLELPHGIPCHDACSWLFRLMKPTMLQAFFDKFPSDFSAAHAEHPAIADKTVAQSNLNVVTAFAHGARKCQRRRGDFGSARAD